MHILDLLPSPRRAVRNTRDSIESLKDSIESLRDSVESLKCETTAQYDRVFSRTEQADIGINGHLTCEFERLEKAIKAHDSKTVIMLWELYRKDGELPEDARKRFFKSIPPATGPLRLHQLGCAQLLSEFNELCKAHNLDYWIAFGTLLGAVRHGGFIPWDDDTDLGMTRADIKKLVEIVEDDSRYSVSVIYDAFAFCRQIRFKYSNENIPCFLDLFLFDEVSDVTHATFEKQAALRGEMIEHFISQDWYQEWQAAGYVSENSILGEKAAAIFDAYLNQAEDDGIISANGSGLIWGIDNLTDLNGYDWICSKGDVLPTQRIAFEGAPCEAPANIEKLLTEVYGNIYSLPDDISTHFAHVDLTDSNLESLHLENPDTV